MGHSSLEFCAGGGGQALGLELAGFECVSAIDNDSNCCATLRLNRPNWDVRLGDMREVSGGQWSGVDLFAAGVPCPPFSIAGKQLGPDDDRDMFPAALRIIQEVRPRAILLENVAGFASQKFSAYRAELLRSLDTIGYQAQWRILQAADYGVPQLRPRFVLVALRPEYFRHFSWPQVSQSRMTVGPCLLDLIASRGWPGAVSWAAKADAIAPTVVGGSRKHGGPDLGPTRARLHWQKLGVDGLGIADLPPGPEFPETGFPRLTTRMVARLQSFPDTWVFSGKKTAAYRQVGNAFPPLVARAVGFAIRDALEKRSPSGSALLQAEPVPAARGHG